MDLDNPVNQNAAHWGVEVLLARHVLNLRLVLFFCFAEVGKDFGDEFNYVLRVPQVLWVAAEDRFVEFVVDPLAEFAAYKFRVQFKFVFHFRHKEMWLCLCVRDRHASGLALSPGVSWRHVLIFVCQDGRDVTCCSFLQLGRNGSDTWVCFCFLGVESLARLLLGAQALLLRTHDVLESVGHKGAFWFVSGLARPFDAARSNLLRSYLETFILGLCRVSVPISYLPSVEFLVGYYFVWLSVFVAYLPLGGNCEVFEGVRSTDLVVGDDEGLHDVTWVRAIANLTWLHELVLFAGCRLLDL